MGTSTAPTVKNVLLTLLRADANLSGVQIDYVDPGEAIGQEEIFFGRTLETEAPAAGMGQRRQREAYDIEVYVYVAVDGGEPQTVEQRAYVLVGELESLVRANNGPGGALSNVLPGGGWVTMAGCDMSPFVFGAQRVCEALCKVSVQATKAP